MADLRRIDVRMRRWNVFDDHGVGSDIDRCTTSAYGKRDREANASGRRRRKRPQAGWQESADHAPPRALEQARRKKTVRLRTQFLPSLIVSYPHLSLAVKPRKVSGWFLQSHAQPSRFWRVLSSRERAVSRGVRHSPSWCKLRNRRNYRIFPARNSARRRDNIKRCPQIKIDGGNQNRRRQSGAWAKDAARRRGKSNFRCQFAVHLGMRQEETDT